MVDVAVIGFPCLLSPALFSAQDDELADLLSGSVHKLSLDDKDDKDAKVPES